MNQPISNLLHEAFSRIDKTDAIVLDRRPGAPEWAHVFDDEGDRSRLALKAALAAGRPLLVRGEPGVGKTQLAVAAARALQRPLVTFVVDSRCEARELLWRFDAVRRLAEAQVCGVLKLEKDAVLKELEVSRFVEPGPLWWGFDWNGAQAHCRERGLAVPGVAADADPANGRVVLIDEVDKAESDLPNGLLEALGSGRFQPPGGDPVLMGKIGDPAPLVVITTNEERVLPDAFVRRCLVLQLRLPDEDEKLQALLVKRGKYHFPEATEALLERAAEMLVTDRRNSAPPKPGQAEYFDLVRAIIRLCPAGKDSMALLERVAEFTLKKQSQ